MPVKHYEALVAQLQIASAMENFQGFGPFGVFWIPGHGLLAALELQGLDVSRDRNIQRLLEEIMVQAPRTMDTDFEGPCPMPMSLKCLHFWQIPGTYNSRFKATGTSEHLRALKERSPGYGID